MLTEIEFLILPYASREGRSILEILKSEFRAGEWDAFRGAVAFAKRSGNDIDLIAAMTEFASRGGSIQMTIGADTFGEHGRGSEYAAVEELLSAFSPFPSASVFLYHERHRTFHPKLYLFSNEARAVAILGSSNWSQGGLSENVEANVRITFDLTNLDHRSSFNELKRVFELYWSEEE